MNGYDDIEKLKGFVYESEFLPFRPSVRPFFYFLSTRYFGQPHIALKYVGLSFSYRELHRKSCVSCPGNALYEVTFHFVFNFIKDWTPTTRPTFTFGTCQSTESVSFVVFDAGCPVGDGWKENPRKQNSACLHEWRSKIAAYWTSSRIILVCSSLCWLALSFSLPTKQRDVENSLSSPQQCCQHVGNLPSLLMLLFLRRGNLTSLLQNKAWWQR